ncbi:hypothetical protein N7455_008747 [Penicillium solitum]|uniref:uncharacterized protein n=1 Tax=Penicillium solitum TaxID=60172 RepID=UPI0032C486C4|nr:hypothetical protein N7455_008747 [Penicillium solitum]
MFSEQNIPKSLQERLARAISRGFTQGNTICHPELAPTTLEKYDYAFLIISRWRISRNESIDPDFPNLPVPTPERLKLFAEFYIKSCKKLPSQRSAYGHFTSFTSKWERETSRSLSKEVKDDPRERFLVNGKDIDYLLRYLFVDDYHDYVIVYRVADGTFKGLATVTEVLTVKPPKGREMVDSKGPKSTKVLTFSLLRHNFTSLAQRDRFKDQLRVHRIRGGVVNKIDYKYICAVKPQYY